MNAKRIIVTGGAGFIGSHVVDRLVKEGEEVLVIDNFSVGKKKNVNQRARLEVVDINDDQAAKIIHGFKPEGIIHLAAQKNLRYSLEQPAADALTNIIGSIKLLEAARQCQVRTFIFSSTGGALYEEGAPRPTTENEIPRPLSPYGAGKRAFELYLDLYHQVYGLTGVSLRLSNVYGPRQDPEGEAGVVAIFCSRALAGESPTIFGDGEQTRDYVYVEDVVEAIWQALGNGRTGVYNIGTGRETSVNDLWKIIAVLSSAKMKPKHIEAIPGELRASCLSYATAEKELGWRPAVGINEGIKRTVDWFSKQ